MNERGKRQASSIFGGMGFYIALLCCVLAAGVVGYYALLNDDTTQTDNPAGTDPGLTVDNMDQDASLPVSGDEDIPSLPVVSGENGGGAPVSAAPQPDSTDGIGAATPVSEDTAPDAEPEGDAVPTVGPADIPVQPQEPMVVMAPLTGEVVAVFSMDALTYDATMNDWRTHDGVDIEAAAGTQVAAAADGTVLSVSADGRLGTTVVIEHQDGYTTTYASLLPEVPVQAGDTVTAGTVIGAVGNTTLTEAGLGAHLHFSVEKDGEAVDPAVFLGE